MNNLSQVLLFAVILCSLGANWDMSGTKSRWSMVGRERSEPITEPAPVQDTEPVVVAQALITDPAPLVLPDLPIFEEVKSIQPVTRTYPRRIRILRR